MRKRKKREREEEREKQRSEEKCTDIVRDPLMRTHAFSFRLSPADTRARLLSQLRNGCRGTKAPLPEFIAMQFPLQVQVSHSEKLTVSARDTQWRRAVYIYDR